jgi:Arc/MetJ-type ribon-helix-helix transcriptional regulator
MTIHLPPNVEDSIRHAVLNGQFASMDDAMTKAASLLLEQLGQTASPATSPRARKSKASRPAAPKRTPITLDELHRQMLAEGLLSQLPDDSQDIDDDQDDEPIVIEGEPLSETIIRERR